MDLTPQNAAKKIIPVTHTIRVNFTVHKGVVLDRNIVITPSASVPTEPVMPPATPGGRTVDLTPGPQEDQECSDETRAERIARRWHETYEELAPEYGYETRKESAKPWSQVPAQNRQLMVATVLALMPALKQIGHEEGYRAGRGEAARAILADPGPNSGPKSRLGSGQWWQGYEAAMRRAAEVAGGSDG